MSLPILISLTSNLIFLNISSSNIVFSANCFSLSCLVGEKFYKHSLIHLFKKKQKNYCVYWYLKICLENQILAVLF